ncbi:hypothetical protein H0H93_013233 [Arthromyces matolae]|nr:hypothetical protein H0H93_013233 [Arthromyces matolae]
MPSLPQIIIFPFKRLLVAISSGGFPQILEFTNAVSDRYCATTNTFYSLLSGIYPSLQVAKQATISRVSAYKELGLSEHEYLVVIVKRGDDQVRFVIERDYEFEKEENATKKKKLPADDKIRLPSSFPRSPGDQITSEIVLNPPLPLYFIATTAWLISEECPLYDVYNKNCYSFTQTFLQLTRRLAGEDGFTTTTGTKESGTWGGVAISTTNDFPSIDDLHGKLLDKIKEFEAMLEQKADAAKLMTDKADHELLGQASNEA